MMELSRTALSGCAFYAPATSLLAFSLTAGVLVATMLTPISLPSIIGQLFNGVDSEHC